MLIGIDARMYGSQVSGIGNYVKNLTDHLFLIDKKNHYLIFMLESGFSQFQPPNSKIKKIKVNCHWYSWKEQYQLLKIINNYNCDLFHFPHFNIPIFYSKKFIVTIHDITPKFFPGPKVCRSLIRKIGYEIVFRTSLKKSSKIITDSYHTKQNLVKHFSVNPEKIAITYLGVDPHFSKIEDYGIIKKLKNEYGITKPFIFYTGVWRQHKNLVNLLKAFKILLEKYNLSLILVLGGDQTNQDPKIKPTIKKLNLDKNLLISGFIPDIKLPIFYNAAEVTVIPSLCEGFGLLAIESLACETPVVASNTTAVPEIISEAGMYFNPNNPQEMAAVIYKILNNKELKNKLIIKGREILKRYNWYNCAQQTLEIYQSVNNQNEIRKK